LNTIAKRVQNFLNESRKKIKPDRRIIVFLFFVFISSLFWFLNQLEADYETNITYPVRFDNFPKNKIIAGELPENFTIRVKARGYKILEYKISNTLLPYVIDVSQLTLRFHSSGNTSTFFTLTRFFEESIESQMGSDFEVIRIMPDTLFFEFTKITTKRVPIISQIQTKTESQYMIKGKVLLDPDSILISGVKPAVDTINQVYTENLLLDKLTKDYSDEVDLLKIKNIEFSNKSTNVSIKVEKYTEGSQRVLIQAVNVPDSLILRVFPNEININYFVGLSDYEKIIPQLFEIAVDYNDTKSQPNNLNVKLINYPDYVQSVRYNPASVEYIIERK